MSVIPPIQDQTVDPSDLRGFDRRARELIAQAMEVGCTGRLSNKGHVILRNNNGGTTAVPRNMSAPNRASQNAEAAVRKLLRTHRTPVKSDPQPSEPSLETISVAQAFRLYNMTFSNWTDQQGREFAPDEQIEVLCDGDQVHFEIVETAPEPTPDPIEEPTAEPEALPHDETVTCPDCGQDFTSQYALAAHGMRHNSPQIHQLAEVNGLRPFQVRERLRDSGAELVEDHYAVNESVAAAADLLFTYSCPLCPRHFAKIRGLRRHVTALHLTEQVATLAELNQMHAVEVIERFIAIDLRHDGSVDASPEVVEAAGLEFIATAVPSPTPVEELVTDEPEVEEPETDQIEAESTTESTSDFEHLVDRVRDQLDRVITEMTRRLHEAEARADRAEAQLALIKETLGS